MTYSGIMIIMSEFYSDTIVRSELALKLKPLIAAQAKRRMSDGAKGVQISAQAKGKTRDDLAKAAGVSHDTIHKVETVMEHGTPEIQAKARSGET